VQALCSGPQETEVLVCPQVEGVRRRTQAAVPVFHLWYHQHPLLAASPGLACCSHHYLSRYPQSSSLVCHCPARFGGFKCLLALHAAVRAPRLWLDCPVSGKPRCVHRCRNPDGLPNVWKSRMCPNAWEPWAAACLEIADTFVRKGLDALGEF